MKISLNQYDAAVSLINYDTKVGELVEVSCSEYNDDQYGRKWSEERSRRYVSGNSAMGAAMRGFAKRGLIEWSPSWRSGCAKIVDLDGLKKIVQDFHNQ